MGPTDVEYLKNQLSLQDTNAQADASFREEIRGAHTRANNMVHNLGIKLNLPLVAIRLISLALEHRDMAR